MICLFALLPIVASAQQIYTDDSGLKFTVQGTTNSYDNTGGSLNILNLINLRLGEVLDFSNPFGLPTAVLNLISSGMTVNVPMEDLSATIVGSQTPITGNLTIPFDVYDETMKGTGASDDLLALLNVSIANGSLLDLGLLGELLNLKAIGGGNLVTLDALGGFIHLNIIPFGSGSSTVGIPVVKIGNEAFKNDAGITNINFDAATSLTTIGASAFSGLTNLTGDVVLPDGVSIIDDAAFAGDVQLRSVTFKTNSILEFANTRGAVAQGVFAGCTGLEFVDMHNGAGAFNQDPNDINNGLDLNINRYTSPTGNGIAYPFYGIASHTLIYLPKDLMFKGKPFYIFEIEQAEEMPLAYSVAGTETNYTVRSTLGNDPQAWTVDGYDTDKDGIYSMAEKPTWLTLNETGTGGAAEAQQATLASNPDIDMLAWRNDQIKNVNPQQGTVDAPYDLSTHNVKGNVTGMNTANAYVISAPGYYKIPLVYGNGIKNGVSNSAAYTSTVTGTYVGTFVDDADNAITFPYINVQKSGSPATSAYVVWEDVAGIIDSPTVKGSGENAYLQFYVPQSAITSANALVGIKDAGGNTLWSWHLWFATDDVVDAVPTWNHINRQNDFTEETLGFVPTLYKGSPKREVSVRFKQAGSGVTTYMSIIENGNKSQLRGNAPLYEFGRKDPFPSYGAIPAENIAPKRTYTVGEAIRSPHMYFINASTANNGGNWLPTEFINIWSATTTDFDKNHIGETVVKTIYDPSIVGYSVPTNDVFLGFGLSVNNNNLVTANATYTTPTTVTGFSFYTALPDNPNYNVNSTIYFPACGQFAYQDGAYQGGMDNLFYWTAIPYNIGDSIEMEYITVENPGDPNPGLYTLGHGNHTRGESIRPMANPN